VLALASALLLGLLLGARHALEPDHLVAVSVLVSRRATPGAGARLGLAWGLGHSASLLAVGCTLSVLGARLPSAASAAFELLVAVMLLTLGGRAVVRAARGTVASPSPSSWAVVRQPLLVGVVHGLAGSGALTAIALAGLPTLQARLAYIVLFGLGSVAGMSALAGLAGWPLARLAGARTPFRWLTAATGTLSLLVGLAWAWSALGALARS